jgi:hypothetical protein
LRLTSDDPTPRRTGQPGVRTRPGHGRTSPGNGRRRRTGRGHPDGGSRRMGRASGRQQATGRHRRPRTDHGRRTGHGGRRGRGQRRRRSRDGSRRRDRRGRRAAGREGIIEYRGHPERRRAGARRGIDEGRKGSATEGPRQRDEGQRARRVTQCTPPGRGRARSKVHELNRTRRHDETTRSRQNTNNAGTQKR